MAQNPQHPGQPIVRDHSPHRAGHDDVPGRRLPRSTGDPVARMPSNSSPSARRGPLATSGHPSCVSRSRIIGSSRRSEGPPASADDRPAASAWAISRASARGPPRIVDQGDQRTDVGDRGTGLLPQYPDELQAFHVTLIVVLPRGGEPGTGGQQSLPTVELNAGRGGVADLGQGIEQNDATPSDSRRRVNSPDGALNTTTFIHPHGLTWLHGLAAFTLFSVGLAMWGILHGDVRMRRRNMLVGSHGHDARAPLTRSDRPPPRPRPGPASSCPRT